MVVPLAIQRRETQQTELLPFSPLLVLFSRLLELKKKNFRALAISL